MLPINTCLFLFFSFAVANSIAFPLREAAPSNLSLTELDFNHHTPHIITTSSRQSSNTETFPVCDFDFALDVLENWNDCKSCADAVEWYDLFGEEHPSARCTPECCSDTFLVPAIGHFLRCENRCCYRLVSLQLSPGLSDELAAFAIQSQGFAVNGVTYVRKTSIGRCVVEDGPSDDPQCGPRCATQIQDRSACAGRNTAEIPRWRQPMELPPCSAGFPDGPPQSHTPQTDPPSDDTSTDEAASGENSQPPPSNEEDSRSGSENDEAPPNSEGQQGGSSSDDNQEDDESNAENSGVSESSVQGSLGNSDPACFPGDGTVSLRNAKVIRMSKLKDGEQVLVGKDEYSEVIGFTHDDREAVSEHVHLSLDSGHLLTLTTGHYMYANEKLVPAGKVVVGDVVRLGDGASAAVIGAERVIAKGLFNPQTKHGDIVVNGVVASTYTEAVDPKMAHAMLAPLRAFSKTGIALDMLPKVASTFRQLVRLWLSTDCNSGPSGMYCLSVELKTT